MPAEIGGDRLFQGGVRAVEEMGEQDEFGGDGGVGFQLEDEMAVGLLFARQAGVGAGDGLVQGGIVSMGGGD